MRRLALLAALLFAPAAFAHGPAGGGVGYVSTVAGLTPNVLGVFVTVLGGDDRLQLANYSGKTVVVLGYDGEPYLRFTRAGVEENVRSPAAYLSRERDPAKAKAPASADPNAGPKWRRISRGSSYAWHDHRIHWTGKNPPAVVQQAPDEVHRIFRWRVPARADMSSFAIEGFLGYAPPVKATSGGRDWTLPAFLGLSGVAAIALVLGERTRRARRRAL